jgi:hypothetical protein
VLSISMGDHCTGQSRPKKTQTIAH